MRRLPLPIPALAFVLLVACEYPDSAAIGSPDGSPTGNPVEVSLTEFAIEMEASPRAGITTFIVTNDGTMDHDFAVVGGAISTGFDEPLAPGESRTLTTSLDAGVYEVFCPIGDHETQGMATSIQVIGPEIP